MAGTQQASDEGLRFLEGGGETARLIARLDWSATPLGPLAAWPRSLRTTVATLLRSPIATALLWGDDGTLIYNDGYALLIGDRHPLDLGSNVGDSLPKMSARARLAAHRLPVLDDAEQQAGVLVLFIETMEPPSEVHHRQILDSAVDYAIIAFDIDGRITRWNEGAHRVLGWTEEEMLGQDGSRFFTPEDQANGRMEAEMRMALATGAGNDERWHLRKSGERFWATGEMTPIRDELGRTTGFVKVLRDRTAEHRSAQELRQSNERLRRAQEAGGVGTFTLDLDGNRLFATPEFCRLFGLAHCDGLPLATVEALVIPEDAHIPTKSLTLEGHDAPLDVEYRIRRADDGALRWIARKGEYEKDADGRVVRLVGVVLDVTERKAAQAALDAGADQFRTLAQALPNHVWTAQPDGRLDWFNDRVYEYSGMARGALDGRQCYAWIHPDDTATATERWNASLASGANYETEFRLRRVDGVYRWHLARAVALRTADGRITRWVGTDVDIDERKRAEVESTRDRERMWTLSQELMLVCDFQGLIIAINPSATRLLGWRQEEMTGRSLVDFLHPEDVERTRAELNRLLQGHPTLAFENRYRSKDGAYKLLDWTAVPDGPHIHAVARDITRERSAEEGLRQSQKMEAVGRLTGGVAHDFNNLLTIIRTSIDLLRRPGLAEDRRRRFMESISNAVQRAAKLTGQLLAFARRQALQPIAFDAVANLQSVGEMIGTLIGSRIELTIAPADPPCVINADPSQFDTAIVNMAVNARDAMGGAGRLTIRIARVDAIPASPSHPMVRGAFIAISLTDTGTGIPPDQIQHIFEPFYTSKEIGLGTGLGLSQVFGFAKQSGGDIHVESTLGTGTTFTLYLPEAAQTGAAVEAESGVEKTARSVDGHGACLLVVEDNPEVAESVAETLHEIGYSVVVAPNASSALAELDSNAGRFAAVFSDVVMAGMDGIQLAHEIRLRHPALPVVLSSGYSEVLAKHDDHGFDLLPKPYSVEMLSQVLREAMAKRSSKQVQQAPNPNTLNLFAHLFADELPHRERNRLNELDSLQILDTGAEARFDDLTRMAAVFCGAPVALISLVDHHRQWFKSRVGLEAAETPREQAFCDHAIRHPEQVMVVNDATRDPRFVDNPLVTGSPGIRFYAGAPLRTSAGHALGTICVIDYEARALDPKQLDMLQLLAAEVVQRMEQRRLELEAARTDAP